MAKLADAADLKSAGRKAVGVQVPLRAPIKSITYGDYLGNGHPRIQRWCHFWCHFVLTLLGSHLGGRSYAEDGGSQGTRSLRKVPGSDIWWIRFKDAGVEHREKVGRRGDAIKLYKIRKADILRGVKMPANMKDKGIKLRAVRRPWIYRRRLWDLQILWWAWQNTKCCMECADHSRHLVDTQENSES